MVDSITLVENKTVQLDLPEGVSLYDLSRYLDEVWQSRMLFDKDSMQEGQSTQQPFLTFTQDLKSGRPVIKAGKYVGFIQFEGITIQIIPKLFGPEQADKGFTHLIWWLSYCQRVRFPFTDLMSDVNSIKDFPEALISYFARFAHQQVSSLPYHQYEETTETLPFLRGCLNSQQYVNNSLSRGNWHQLVCDYEPFTFNNRLNQIIKYVARKLTHICRFPDTHRNLEKLIFILDEVDDMSATIQDCDSLHLNQFYQEYESCLAMCRFFLADSYLTRADTDQVHLCFLVPMDYVYEDFIAGVIEQHFTAYFKKITTQATKWLTEEKVFQIRNDILLTYPSESRVIADTKYKVREYINRKAGISQTDLYQVVSYGLRQNTQQILLLYPTPYGKQPTPIQELTVTSKLMDNRRIHIQAVDLTITGETKQDMLNNLLIELRSAFAFSTNQ